MKSPTITELGKAQLAQQCRYIGMGKGEKGETIQSQEVRELKIKISFSGYSEKFYF